MTVGRVIFTFPFFILVNKKVDEEIIRAVSGYYQTNVVLLTVQIEYRHLLMAAILHIFRFSQPLLLCRRVAASANK